MTAYAAWPRWLRYLLLLIVGAAGGLGFAPIDLWPFTLLSLALLCFALEQEEGRWPGFLTAWFWAFGNFLAGQYWIAHAFNFQANMPPSLGILAVVLLSMFMAIYPAAAAALAVRIRKGPLLRALAFAGAWMLTEWLRGYLLGGFGWNPIGVVTLPMGGAAQAAAVIGALGLSGLVILCSYGFSLFVLRRWKLGTALAAPLVLAATVLPFAKGETVPSETRVDIVQANIPQELKYGPGRFLANLERYAVLSPPPTDEPRLLIWPEAAIPRFLDDMPELRRELGFFLLGDDDLLLTGAMKALGSGEDGDPWGGLNSLYVIGPDGGIRARYDKQRLVPYGEYLPLRPVLSAIGLAQLAPSAVDTYAGVGPRTLQLPGFPNVGAMICYEVIYPEQADGHFRPRWLLNVSNDAWFSDGGAAMHLAHARLRAIEQGLPMARSTPTGISAIIDPWGRVLEMLPRDETGVLSAALPAPRAETIFARTGSALPLSLAVLMLVVAVVLPPSQKT